MDAIFVNSDNCKTSDPHKLKRELINMLLYQTLAFAIHEEILQSQTKIINLTYQLRHGMKSLNYLLDHILYQLFISVSVS